MRRLWPPVIYIGVSIGSLFILRGTSGDFRPGLAITGIVMLLAVLGVGIYLAVRAWPDRPRHPGVYAAIGGMALWYVLFAGAGAIAGPEYATAGLLAGVIPVAAISLLVATMRQKTVHTGDGRLLDATADDENDPYPGIGLDDETPAGETTELHDLDREDTPDRRFQRRPEAGDREHAAHTRQRSG